jgi:hypothetical protein
MANSPTALNKRGNKVLADGFTFDSTKEFNFYCQFVKPSGYPFAVHPRYVLEPLHPISGGKITAIAYKPDFVIYNRVGDIMHVYDVKNSLGPFGIDQSNKLRFRLFAMKVGIPVEAVVVRSHDFKVIAQGVSKPLNEKAPLIKRDFQYDWTEATNY